MHRPRKPHLRNTYYWLQDPAQVTWLGAIHTLPLPPDWLTHGSSAMWHLQSALSVFSALAPTTNQFSLCLNALKDKEIAYSSVVTIRRVGADPCYQVIL